MNKDIILSRHFDRRVNSPLGFLLCAVCTILLALLLLAASTLLPQQRIDRHVLSSSASLLAEGLYPKFHDYGKESQLDNFTDAIMLEEARGTTRTNISSILTNPRHSCEESANPVEELAIYATEDADSPASWSYARYWMGFRVLLRFWLSFFSYLEIRRYLSFAFFLLFIINILAISKHTNSQIALFFALSIVLVRPQTIASSMQFSCCFFIVFFALLAVPSIYRNDAYEGLFFFELGMITQYFDFYTTPLLTFGYPMVYLFLLHNQKGARLCGKRVFKAAVLWAVGYVLMWIAKLAVTTWLTDVDGFADGFDKMFIRIGIHKDERYLNEYNPLVGLYNVFFRGLTDDRMSRAVALAGIIMVVAVCVFYLYKKRLSLYALSANRSLLFLGFLPIVWFIFSAEPTAIHFWFQYRNIALSYWALGAWLASSISGRAIA